MSRRFFNFLKAKIINFNFKKRMYIILKGTVLIQLSQENKSIDLNCLSKGDFFGEISIFHKIPRTATAIAMDNVELYYIENYEELKNFLTRNSSFAVRMIEVLASRLAHTDAILLKEFKDLNDIRKLIAV